MKKKGTQLSKSMLDDFDTYRWDGHTALAAITSMRRSELEGVLLLLLQDAPSCLARALAIEQPLDADRQDSFERFVQQQLPSI